MSDLKRYKILKGGMKGSLNKSLKDLEDFLSKATSEQVEGKRLTVSKSLATYESYAEQIYGLLSTTEEVEEEMSNDLAYIEEVNTCLARLTRRPESESDSIGKSKISGFNLPKLSLPSFSGDPTTWTAFWDIFDCSVHQNRNLTPVQKFTYLRGQLKDEALKLVEGYKLETSSYASAVDLLKKTYGRPDLIKAALITKFLELVPPAYEISGLKEFYASFECLLRSMGSMNVTMDDICSVAIFNKIPTPLRGILRRRLEDTPLELESLIQHFRTEVFDMETNTGMKLHTETPIATAAFPVQTPRGDVRTTVPDCRLCGNSHAWYKCLKYPKASQKIDRAKALKICTSCLSSDHAGKTCTNPLVKPCKFCTNKHYFSLCTRSDKQNKVKVNKGHDKSQTSVDDATTQVSALAIGTKERQLLPTVMMPIVGCQTRYHLTRTLLDQCSQRSFVLRSSLPQFKCTSLGQETLQLEGFTGGIDSQKYDVVELCYLYRRKQYALRTVVVDKLPNHYVSSEIRSNLTALKKRGFKLADPELAENRNKIELLVGADYYYDLVHPGYHREDTLILLPTKQGYAVTGSYAASSQETQVEVVTVLKVAISPIDKYVITTDHDISCPSDLNKLWDLDNIGICSHELDILSKQVLTTYEETVEYDSANSQYIVKLPWNENKDKLPSNFGMAMGRLRSLQRQFQVDPQYCQAYSAVIAEQERRGFIERVDSAVDSGPVHYLAHHGIKKDSPTTPIRIVYDCSAKTSSRSYSLNNCLHTGPSLVSDLAQILMRFRCGRFAWVADIEKAFLMLQLHHEDRDYTRFLWPQDPMNTESGVILFRFKAVLFGATCSQFLLNATILRHIAEADLEPDLRQEIRKGLYIDNLHGSGDNEEELLHKYWKVRNVFAKAHLHLREWTTNSCLLQDQVISDGVAAQDSTVKFLGLKWNIDQDCLSYSFQPVPSETLTKRYCLSLTAQLFDPLGLLLPVTIRARLFLQQLWRLKLDWDQLLPVDLHASWHDIQSDLLTCSEVLLDRQAISGHQVDVHAFSDASNSAYGTAIYLCNGKEARLIVAKGRVAPIKKVTVPKLELTALLLSARLIKFTLDTYAGIFQLNNLYVWSDSKIALSWIHSSKVLPVYVSNRTDEIRNLIPTARFRYVNTKDNPSDVITRGVSTQQLLSSSAWWQGPTWLISPTDWPQDDREHLIDSSEWSQEVVCSSNVDTVPLDKLVDWERYGSYDRIVRILAWMFRFINNLRAQGNADGTYQCEGSRVLRLNELTRAETCLIKLAQKESYPAEHKLLNRELQAKPTNLMRQLGLYMEGGIIKCKGRIHNADIDNSTKFPILLSSSHLVTQLLIRKCHELCLHYGVNYVLAYMRRRWWIPKMRQAIKKIHTKCLVCKRLQGKPYPSVNVPPLPEFRVQRADPFQVTGVDFTGAIQVRGSRGESIKVYAVLFTCAVTRAIHIELIDTLSCEGFLHTLRRFASRNGFPQIILSDNATCFVGASNYIKNLIEDPQVISTLAGKGCQWTFIPARAPWFGAIWERTIGTVKSALKKVLGKAFVNVNELQTILLEIEMAVNDRPLTYTSTSIDDALPISPSMLTRGRQLNPFPKSSVTDGDLTDPTFCNSDTMKSRFQYVTKVTDDLWKRWTQDYLLSLRERHSNLLKTSPHSWPKVGDIVLIHDTGPRICWKLGKIMELYLGVDGHVRVARLKTSAGITTRPVVRLYPLEQDLETGLEPSHDPKVRSSDDYSSNDTTPQDSDDARPRRRAALGSKALWRSKIATGDL